jgi:hypothetical protein
MKLQFFLLAFCASHVSARAITPKEIANPPRQERYVSGAVHRELMGRKESTFAKQRNSGAYNSFRYKPVTKFTPCEDGRAGNYQCGNIDLYSFTPHSELGSVSGEGSSIWGWTSDDGREIVIVGQVGSSSPGCGGLKFDWWR